MIPPMVTDRVFRARATHRRGRLAFAHPATLLPAVALMLASCTGTTTPASPMPGSSASDGASNGPSPAASSVDTTRLPGRYTLPDGLALDLATTGDAFIVRDPQSVAHGTWSANGNRITFEGNPCPGSPGTWHWTLDEGRLLLKPIDDGCAGRTSLLAQPLARSPEVLPWAVVVESRPLDQPAFRHAAVDAKGYFYSTDGSASIHKYTADGTLVATFGGLSRSSGVTVDVWGNIYADNADEAVIVRLDVAGKPVLRWKVDSGTVGPAGLAHDTQGRVYAALHGSHDHFVEQYSPGGMWVASWAPAGDDLGQVGGGLGAGPEEIAVDGDGSTVITDPLNNRLVAYDGTGRFLFNVTTGGKRRLVSPVVVAMNSAGAIYTLQNGEVWKWDPGGTYVGAWFLPYAGDLVVDATDHLWVVGSRIVSVALPEP